MPKEPTRKVYSLLIGIDNYREDIDLGGIRFPKLSGCVNDINNILSYLKDDPLINLEPIILKNENATKGNIIKAIRSELTQAQEKDTILIYYSGHGTVETANRNIWKGESDSKLEAIVCFFEESYSPEFLLVDKEFRFLLNELYNNTKSHIVTIFDCCHSGDNTRAGFTEKIKVRKIDFEFPMRDWAEFIFANEIRLSDFQEGSMIYLPQGGHVQMSAAESDELAFESGGNGVFTKLFIQTLKQTGGSISYIDLHNRIKNKIKVLFDQNPKLYAPNEYDFLLQKGFLNKKVGVESNGVVIYNEGKRSWILNKGILHGMNVNITAIELSLPGLKDIKGGLISADLDSSLIKFEDEDLLNRSLSYSTKIHGIKQRTLGLRLVNENSPLIEVEEILNQLNSLEEEGIINVTDNPEKIDYNLIISDDLLYVCFPNDNLRPLTKPIFIDQKEAAITLVNYLRHISSWTFLKELDNLGEDKLSKDLVHIEFSYIDPFENKTQLVADNKGFIILPPKSTEGKVIWGGRLIIKVTNTSDANLHLAGVYFDNDFSSDTRLFEPQVSMVEPGISIVIKESKNGIPISFDDKWYWYNWEKDENYLKFIFSTVPFSHYQLQKGGLPIAEYPGLKGFRGGLDFDLQPTALNRWNTKLYKLVFPNSKYNQDISRKLNILYAFDQELIRMGSPSYIGHFASRLYLQQLGLGKISLKPSNEKEGSKNFFWTAGLKLGNKWSNYWRNRRYFRMAKKLPDIPHLLAEGDSWFQHPLLKDIIDNLGRFYPVYCLSAAGDTIRNYIKEGSFIQEIARINPAVLLISGGGNDVLGKNLTKFLAKSIYSPLEPKDFFSDELINEMHALSEIYRTIFDYYETHLPNLHIIVHGYDYPQPVAPGTKERNWIGKYLDEKGIKDESERSTVIRYLMDEFNASLKEAASEFNNTHYLDLRGIVMKNQWYDEIHPNNTGYQNVSLKFVQKINALIGKN